MNENNEVFETSYFNMWRALVALSHIDNDVSDREKTRINEFVKNLRLNDQMKETLILDLDTPQSPDQYIEQISIPAHISQLHHFANIIFKVDGLHHKEEVYFKKIKEIISKKVNYLGALQMVEEQKRVAKSRPVKKSEGFFGMLIDYFNEAD